MISTYLLGGEGGGGGGKPTNIDNTYEIMKLGGGGGLNPSNLDLLTLTYLVQPTSTRLVELATAINIHIYHIQWIVP